MRQTEEMGKRSGKNDNQKSMKKRKHDWKKTIQNPHRNNCHSKLPRKNSHVRGINSVKRVPGEQTVVVFGAIRRVHFQSVCFYMHEFNAGYWHNCAFFPLVLPHPSIRLFICPFVTNPIAVSNAVASEGIKKVHKVTCTPPIAKPQPLLHKHHSDRTKEGKRRQKMNCENKRPTHLKITQAHLRNVFLLWFDIKTRVKTSTKCRSFTSYGVKRW